MKIDEMLVTTTKNNPSLSYSQLDWIYYHIFFFFDLGKEIEKDNFFSSCNSSETKRVQ